MVGVLPSANADPIPVGKIPDGGVQVLKSENIRDGEVIIHTVSTGKILYWSTVALSASYLSDVTGNIQLYIRDENDVNTMTLHLVSCKAYEGVNVFGSFLPPIEISALWDIVLVSSVADLSARCFIHGYEA